jgi:methyltransferase (TIGR00027 family)
MRIPFLPRELHTTDRPSSTAQWTAVGRTLELERPPAERIIDDPFAPLFLTGTSRAVIAGLRAAGPAVRLAERHELVGVSAFALCRHRFIDEHMLEALRDGVEQVLVLGAGYDSRAYRFAAESVRTPVYEVDLPPLSQRKAAIVAANPAVFGHTTINRIEIDFRTQSLADRLAESGFAAGRATYIAWEGVSPYLTREAVSGTLSTLRELCGEGSVLAMDYWEGTGGGGLFAPVRRVATHAFRLVGEPLAFGIRPEAVGDFLDFHEFEVFDLVQSKELAARYSTGGRPCERSTYVVAARL